MINAMILQLKRSDSIKFDTGKIVATPGAIDALTDPTTRDYMPNIVGLLSKHVTGDWGDVCPADARANEQALKDDSRILSVYKSPVDGETKIWIITEADRSVTTFLLPSDY